MKLSELEAAIEAILFTMGEAVELERIAAATQQDEDTCRRVIRSMMDKFYTLTDARLTLLLDLLLRLLLLFLPEGAS